MHLISTIDRRSIQHLSRGGCDHHIETPLTITLKHRPARSDEVLLLYNISLYVSFHFCRLARYEHPPESQSSVRSSFTRVLASMMNVYKAIPNNYRVTAIINLRCGGPMDNDQAISLDHSWNPYYRVGA